MIIGKRWRMEKIMLTVLKGPSHCVCIDSRTPTNVGIEANMPAYKFYERMRYHKLPFQQSMIIDAFNNGIQA